MSEHLPEAYRICAELVKRHDPDRHIAALFAPAAARPRLHALQAFSLEIAGVRGTVKEPLPGEIRLQWWRDALSGERQEEAAGHPVALAILDTIRQSQLPLQPFQDLIDARVSDLYDDPPEDWNALEGYCGETSSALIRLASLILAQGSDPGGADASGHAGVAYAITGLLRAFPWHARRGQVFLPGNLMRAVGLSLDDIAGGKDSESLRAALAAMRVRARDHLDKAVALQSALPVAVIPAFLPLATVEGYLRSMERANYDPFSAIVDIPQWQRVWKMWRWTRR